jgi:hypothetical protein
MQICQGETEMTDRQFPQESQRFEIQACKQPKKIDALRKTHVPFSGSPRRHPYDAEKIVLIPDPYASGTGYYEFRAEDIAYAEELPNLVNLDGETLTMVRVWIKKMSVGVQCTPFLVSDLEGK